MHKFGHRYSGTLSPTLPQWATGIVVRLLPTHMRYWMVSARRIIPSIVAWWCTGLASHTTTILCIGYLRALDPEILYGYRMPRLLQVRYTNPGIRSHRELSSSHMYVLCPVYRIY